MGEYTNRYDCTFDSVHGEVILVVVVVFGSVLFLCYCTHLSREAHRDVLQQGPSVYFDMAPSPLANASWERLHEGELTSGSLSLGPLSPAAMVCGNASPMQPQTPLNRHSARGCEQSAVLSNEVSLPANESSIMETEEMVCRL